LGDVIWWNYPLSWKATLMIYDMGFWIIGGLVLTFFLRFADSPIENTEADATAAT